MKSIENKKGGKCSKGLMKEPGSVSRGLVPDVAHGRQDESYNVYLEKLDPRGDSEKSEEVRIALAQANDSRFQDFLERLYLPHYRQYSLAAIAKACGISLPQFGEFWQKVQNVRALAIAQDGIVDLTPDMIADAKTRRIYCERCDGWGWVFAEEGMPDTEQRGERTVRQCPACEGEKKTSKPGDADSRRMLLEMTGHIGKRGGGVQIVQNFSGSGIESAVQKLSAVTFDVEAEVVD